MHTFALDAAVTDVTMETILQSVGTFITDAVGWMGSVLNTITSNPVLLLMVILLPIGGYVVGLLSRLIRL